MKKIAVCVLAAVMLIKYVLDFQPLRLMVTTMAEVAVITAAIMAAAITAAVIIVVPIIMAA